MNIREFISIFTTAAMAAVALNVSWLAVLAAPVSWVWNWAVVPVTRLPVLDYQQTFGLLLLWFLLRMANAGIRLSAKARD